MDMVHDYVHFGERNQTNSLIWLNNRGSLAPDPSKCEPFDDKIMRPFGYFERDLGINRWFVWQKADTLFSGRAPVSTALRDPPHITEEGIEMRLLALLVAISAFSQTAAAQTPNCRSIQDPTARLACYDKAAPAPAKPAAAASAKPPAAKVDTGKYVDSVGEEEALVNSRLKNICRGC
jgi:hypothetical protein